MKKEISLEDFKKAWKEVEVKEAKEGFLAHLTAYIIVNAFLIFVNLWTGPGKIWFVWPLAGWAIGLAFHGIFSRAAHVTREIEKKIALIEYLAREKI
ncbi:MAG: 2TM domain-containing protein [Candidatus Bathyarchaeia archaeon]